MIVTTTRHDQHVHNAIFGHPCYRYRPRIHAFGQPGQGPDAKLLYLGDVGPSLDAQASNGTRCPFDTRAWLFSPRLLRR